MLGGKTCTQSFFLILLNRSKISLLKVTGFKIVRLSNSIEHFPFLATVHVLFHFNDSV